MFTETTSGLVKAAVQVAARAGKDAKRRAENPRFTYEPDGYATHGTKYLNQETRDEINAVLKRYHDAESQEERTQAVGDLQKFPIVLVQVKRETKVDRSRYSGEKIREFNSYGGRLKEQNRAYRRVKAMREGVNYGALSGPARAS